MASIMTSMPLLGDSRPKVRMTVLSAKPSLALACVGLDEGEVGNAVRDDLDLLGRHADRRCRSSSRALLGHDDDAAPTASMIALEHGALRRRRLGQDGVQRRDDRHGQPRQQRQDVAAGLAAEDAELVLQRDDVELAGVQEVGRRARSPRAGRRRSGSATDGG